MVVIVKAQRLMQAHALVQHKAALLQKFTAARVARIQNGHIVHFGQMVDGGEQVGEILFRVDVLPGGPKEEDTCPFPAPALPAHRWP